MEDPKIQALLEDVVGQVTEAFSKTEWFKKWGRHYIPSLQCGHRMQLCNNFKDPGVQLYGGALFKEIQTFADDIFLKLPAPVPSAPPARQYSAHGGRRKKCKSA